MIVLDPSGVVALLLRTDPNHVAAREAVRSSRLPMVVPAGIMAEIAYVLAARGGERLGGRVLTFDHRHFGGVAREGTITILP